MQAYTGLEIAIIGMAGRFPGAPDIRAYWEKLANGIESISFFSDEELLQAGVEPGLVNHPGYIKANAILNDKEFFDADFFNYRPDEARLMDPQMRIFHECVWSALEDAGYHPGDPGVKAGLFAGASANLNWELFARLINRDGLVDDFTASQLSNARFLPTRLSYFLNMRGPSMYLDTACSTSLVAVNHACKSLLMGECNLALAGGVTITARNKEGYLYTDDMIQSSDGHCRAFDAGASGTVAGEGAGVVVLKTLKQALRDGDHIWAIIKGTAINNDGNHKVGYAAPSISGQAEAIQTAHKWAQVPAESITYIEAHGTGTRLGDPVEVEALNQAFGKSREPYCAIGSVKTNIGHLDVAAGIAGLIKAVLAVKHRQIPPSLHFSKANEAINFKDSPFYVNTILKEWTNNKYPLRAGVSSFGIGGTNAHVVLEEAPAKAAASPGRKSQLLVLSGKTAGALQRNKQNLLTFIITQQQPNLADIAYTLQVGRVAWGHRETIVCRDKEEAITLLGASKANAREPVSVDKARPMIVFMFPGQGAQYTGMCRELYSQEAFFRDEVDKCCTIIKKQSGIDVRDLLWNNGGNIDDTANTQPVLFVVEYALARLLMHWGIQPDKMIGHSIGEYVAACISGVFSLEDALWLVVKRGELMQSVPGGKMLAVSITEEELMPLLQEHNNVSLAAENSSGLYVLSGTYECIDNFKQHLKERGHACRDVRTSHAFHSYMMDDITTAFAREVQKVKMGRPQIPIISNVSGQELPTNEVMEADYWVKHLRGTVHFSAGIVTLLQQKQVVLIETGPGKILGSFVRSNTKREKGHVVVSLVKQAGELMDDITCLQTGIGQLWSHGVELAWKNYYSGENRQKVSLPAYSFEQIKYPVYVNAFSMLAGSLAGLPFETDIAWSTDQGPANDEAGTINFQSGTSTSLVDEKLTTLWQQFFGKSTIGPDDDFFETGGDSLKAQTFTGRIRKVFGVEVSMKAFFSHATIRQLATYINGIIPGSDEAVQIAGSLSIPVAEKKNSYPLSPAQRRLYFLHQLDELSLAYNLPLLIWVDGDIDRRRLEGAFNALLMRHDSLRLSFELVNGMPVQKIKDHSVIEVEYYKATEQEIQQVVASFIRPFDLETGPLLRACVITIGPGKYLFITDLHHIIADGVSSGILMKEFIALYNNEVLPVQELQYPDYAVWFQGSGRQEEIATQKDFWINAFAGELNVLDLPVDFPRPLIKTYEGNALAFELNVWETAALRGIAEAQGATMYMVILAIYNVLLGRLGNCEDLVVGTPVAGRAHADLENIIGMFVNTLPLRNYPRGEMSFTDFLAQVKTRALASFDHQFYPYEALIDDLEVERNTGRNPLFDVLFSYTDTRAGKLEWPGFTVRPFKEVPIAAQFDLALSVFEATDVLTFDLRYATTLFKETTVQRFIEGFKKIVAALMNNPSTRIADIEIITAEEKEQVVKTFNDTVAVYPREKNINNLFEEIVKTRGEAIALTFEGKGITYNELNAKSNQLARKILGCGIEQGSVIGIMLPRSHEMIIAIWAILKAGCAYTPIDPGYPFDRIQFMAADSGMRLVLTASSLAPVYSQFDNNIVIIDITAGSIYTGNDENLDLHFSSTSLAYLIYTSGSTGHPKGVMIEHRSVVNFVYGTRAKIRCTDYKTILCLTTISFDIFVLETILPLLSGLQVIMASEADQKDPTALASLITRQKVELLQVTPSHLKLLLAAGNEPFMLEQLQVIMVGGEAFPGDLLKELQEAFRGRIYNMYGPTETTVWSAIQELTGAAAVTIGGPIANTTLRIVDRYNNLQPIGLTGELCIGGDGLTRGYWKNALLTGEKIIPDPVNPNEKLYRTGDLVKWLPDGSIEFVGRADYQVKLRGFRIELGEIESQLMTYNGISQATVVKRENEGDEFLVGYYVAENEIEMTDIRNYLLGKLPDYMVPAYFVHLASMPLTPNGKINRKALPAPQKISGVGFIPPANEWEQELAAIWQEVLQVESIGTNVDFFVAGGNSLKLIQLFKLIDARYPKCIKVMDLFSNRTLAGLAALLKNRLHAGKRSEKKQTTILDF